MLKIDPKKHPKLYHFLLVLLNALKIIAVVCFSLFITLYAFYSFRFCERDEKMISAKAEEVETISEELGDDDYFYYFVLPVGLEFITSEKKDFGSGGLIQIFHSDYTDGFFESVLLSYSFIYGINVDNIDYYDFILSTEDGFNFVLNNTVSIPLQYVHFGWLNDFISFASDGYFSISCNAGNYGFQSVDNVLFSIKNDCVVFLRRVPKDGSLNDSGGASEEDLQAKYEEGFKSGYKDGYEDGSGGIKIDNPYELKDSDYFYYIQLREGMSLKSMSSVSSGYGFMDYKEGGDFVFFSYRFGYVVSANSNESSNYATDLCLIPGKDSFEYTVAYDYWIPLQCLEYSWAYDLQFDDKGLSELSINSGDYVFHYANDGYFVLGGNSVDLPMVGYNLQVRRVPKGVVITGVDNGELDVKYNEGYSSGYSDGETIGKEEGKVIGYDNGYSVGFQDGFDSSSIGGFDWLISSVQSFLNVNFFGDFGVGTLLYVGLGMTLVCIFLKMFAGA